jgi:hypothetical protein
VTAANELGINLTASQCNLALTRGDDIGKGFDGLVATYPQVINNPQLHRALNSRYPTFGIMDEIHWNQNGKPWGEGLKEACELCIQTLAMTATPNRSGSGGIPFVTYDDEARVSPTVHYTRKEALKDRVVRPYNFLLLNAETEWAADEEHHVADFDDELNDVDSRRRLRTALASDDLLTTALETAHKTLLDDQLHRFPTAQGIVFADDINDIVNLARILKRLTGQDPTIVHHNIPGAHGIIKQFASSDKLWLINCRMVGEGVDNPRLTTVAYLSKTRAQLTVEQAIGRAARVHRDCPDIAANIITLSDPEMKEIVDRLEREQLEVIGEENPEPGSGGPRGPSHPSFVPISAVATDQMAIANGIFIPPEALRMAELYKRQADDPAYLSIPTPILAKFMMEHDIRPHIGAKPGTIISRETLEDRQYRERKIINKLANRLAGYRDVKPDHFHRSWIELGHKPNDAMDLSGLEAKKAWLLAQLATSQRTSDSSF